ncbi:hypothetical protein, partial [Escherichia coli]|uniref:hypothetical protein n=1 Tax=Escherichia coli TaxID=562 RepID=UPI001AD8E918
MTKTERKSKFNEHKRQLKEIWTTEMESLDSDTENSRKVPSHYKRYTIEDKRILLQTPNREKPQQESA